MAELLGQSVQAYNSYVSIYGNNMRGYTAISPAIVGDTLEYIIIKAARRGTSGNVTIKVYNTAYVSNAELAALADGTVISLGSQIGTVTVDSSGWSTASADRTFTFGAAIDLPIPNELIIFTVEHDAGDSSNCIRWSTPTGSAYTRVQSVDGGTTWTKETGTSGIYQTWGTRLSAPGAPANPSPTDDATDITLDETPLSWDASDPTADTYEIYFREQGDDWSLVGIAQAGIEWAVEFGTLAYGTIYEWRVDATNEVDTTTGDTWTFTCLAFAPPQTSYVLIIGGSGDGPYDDPPGVEGTDWSWTGENNMLTVRRLVVAVEDKIWYEDL